MEFDAQLIGLDRVLLDDDGSSGDREEDLRGGVGDGPTELWGMEDWNEKVAKWMFCGDERNVRGVWVRGRGVVGVGFGG